MFERPATAATARRFGARLRTLRAEKGITQEQLALAVDVGKGFLSEVESGKKFPSVPTMIELARELGVDLVDLFVLDASDPRQTLLDAARRGDRVAVMAALKKLGLG
jgi:transcriptional regulator with XRE-family HTH domain